VKIDSDDIQTLGTRRVGLREFKRGAGLDVLERDPLTPVALTSHGTPVARVVSDELWGLLMDALDGKATVFTVPIPGSEFGKTVVARVVHDSFPVSVDGMAYTFVPPKDNSDEPDHAQLIWRHHPDVARALVSRVITAD